MKIDEVIRLLKTSNRVINDYFSKGTIRRTKLDDGKYDYNYDDIKKLLDDRKIVLINPNTYTIDKTYNNIDEVIDDLKLNKQIIHNCLRNVTNSGGGYIIKYKYDATNDKIKIYSDKHNHKQIVLIDPKTQSINKTYNDIKEAIDDLDLKVKKENIRLCLNNKIKMADGYILKYKKGATEDNIKLYANAYCHALDGTIKCPCCKEWVDPGKFKKDYCIICGPMMKQKNSIKRINSYNGFLSNMAGAIKHRSSHHIKMGKIGICNIDTKFLDKLYKDQKGLCYYSGIELSTKMKSDWQASPERLRNDIGYTKENVRLVCLEFNIAHAQWNREKLNQLITLREKIVDINDLKQKIETAKIRKLPSPPRKIKRKIKVINGDKYYECMKCNKLKIISKFAIRKKYNIPYYCCFECEKIKKKEYKDTLRGFLISKLGSAKHHIKKIHSKKKRIANDYVFTLTLNDLFDKLLEQKGKCYYSGVNLSFVPNSDWMVSLERLDSTKGYTKKNTVLICVEFNSTDTTANRTIEGTGSGQWSKEKVALLLDTINKQKLVPTNYKEWRSLIDTSTLETHDPNLFRMKFKNKRKPTNYKEWKSMIDSSTLETYDPELFQMRFRNTTHLN